MSTREDRTYQRFTNQKQLRAGESQENIVHLSGDESTDNRVEISSEESVVDLQKMLGGPFMHPMHDASADQQFAPPVSPTANETTGI